jgi:hypothetical protein
MLFPPFDDIVSHPSPLGDCVVIREHINSGIPGTDSRVRESFRPACAKPRLPKYLYGGQALRRRQGGTSKQLDPEASTTWKNFFDNKDSYP